MKKSFLYLTSDLERRVNMARNQSVVSPETVRQSLDCLDLTSLRGNETDDDIRQLCNKAMMYHLRAVCVFPDKVRVAAQSLRGVDVKVATVINFPDEFYSDDRTQDVTPELTAEKVSRAVASGATQIDIVQPRDVRPGFAQDVIRAARIACPKDITLMSILETASYKDSYDLADAALIAIASGADFLKTSTGRHVNGGASLDAAAILLQTIKKSGQAIGLKVSGGIKTAEECAQYMALQRSFLGWSGITNDRFAIGGSQVLDDLVRNIAFQRLAISGCEDQPANQPIYAP